MHVVFSEMYWSKLPDNLLKNLVDLFQKESAMLIGRIAVVKLDSNIEKHLKKFVRILQMVYQVLFFLNIRSKLDRKQTFKHIINHIMLF